jgi:hypothetical protein
VFAAMVAMAQGAGSGCAAASAPATAVAALGALRWMVSWSTCGVRTAAALRQRSLVCMLACLQVR